MCLIWPLVIVFFLLLSVSNGGLDATREKADFVFSEDAKCEDTKRLKEMYTSFKMV